MAVADGLPGDDVKVLRRAAVVNCGSEHTAASPTQKEVCLYSAEARQRSLRASSRR